MNKVSIEIFSPAKINLFLAVIGQRGDGFHELLSLVAQVGFGDSLKMQLVNGKDSLECDYTGLPTGDDNIILKAIKSFRRKYAFQNGVKIQLEKRIPMGAGLGGGSSNAVAALRGVNELLGGVLTVKEMKEIAVELGSDCSLFFEDGPVIMSGRGELIRPVKQEFHHQLSGQKILIFKPNFSINTAWAYEQMRSNPGFYIEREDAAFVLDEGIERFLASGDFDGILYNNFEKIIFPVHKELGELIKNLSTLFGVKALMSGSGSACFCILQENSDLSGIKQLIKQVLGEEAFMTETVIC